MIAAITDRVSLTAVRQQKYSAVPIPIPKGKSQMAKKSQTPPPNPPEDSKEMVHIDFDFDFKFYASPQAKQLLQWLGQVLKWAFPFLIAFSTVRSVGVEPTQIPPLPYLPPIEAPQSPPTEH
jgi:hypothetical protein